MPDAKAAQEPMTDAAEMISYLQNSAEAHPHLDARALLAQAAYIYAAEGRDRVRRAAHVELHDRGLALADADLRVPE